MRKLLLLGIAAGSLVAASNARALPISYQIFDGAIMIGSGSNNTTGVLPISGSDSAFTILGAASSQPALNSPDFSSQTFNIQASGGAAATLTIKVTDVSLSPYSGSVANFFTLNPLNGATFTNATISNYVDASNTPYGTATLLATTGPISTNPTSTITSAITMPGLFSETTIYTLNFAAGGPSSVSASASLNSIPEPISLAILGAGLAGVGMIRRRRH